MSKKDEGSTRIIKEMLVANCSVVREDGVPVYCSDFIKANGDAMMYLVRRSEATLVYQEGRKFVKVRLWDGLKERSEE